MCQMSIKLPAMFDQNPLILLIKWWKNRLQQKMLSMLYFEPKCQGHSRNQKTMTLGTKKLSTKKNLDANSSKTICRPPTTGGGQHKYCYSQ